MAPDAGKPAFRLLTVLVDSQRAQPLLGAAPPAVVTSVAAALARLRTESFDGVVALHGPPRLDALMLARALRGAGDETPMAILGVSDTAARDAGADFGLEADAFEDLRGRLLAAVESRRSLHESRLALITEQQRLASAVAEASQLAEQQHELLAALREVAGPDVRRYPAAEQPAQETPASRAA